MKNRKKALIILITAAIAITFTACVTKPMDISPEYSTRGINSLQGEIRFGEVVRRQAGLESMQDPNYMGAVRLEVPVAYFCSNALLKEIDAVGLRLDDKAPLQLDAVIRHAETVWKNQGSGGVFTTDFVISFTLTDELEQAVYAKIHQGSASHNQTYGGYPASASVADALANTIERCLTDPEFIKTLRQADSVNLGNMLNEDGAPDFDTYIFRDYDEAAETLAPYLIRQIESDKYDEVFALSGFPGKNGRTGQLSEMLTNKLEELLTDERFQLASRDLEAVFEEQKLQLSGLIDEDTVIKAGELAGADKLIAGRLVYNEQESTILWEVRVLDTESGLADASYTLNLLATQAHLEMLESRK